MTCDRDRALLAFYVSSGARASELLAAGVSVANGPEGEVPDWDAIDWRAVECLDPPTRFP